MYIFLLLTFKWLFSLLEVDLVLFRVIALFMWSLNINGELCFDKCIFCVEFIACQFYLQQTMIF